MPLDEETKQYIAESNKQLVTQILTSMQTAQATPDPAPAQTPSDPASNTPLTKDDLKDIFNEMNTEQRNQLTTDMFEQTKEDLLSSDPGFKKFFEEGTDLADRPFKDLFDQKSTLKEKTQMLKNLHSNYRKASQPPAGTPETPPKSKTEQDSDSKMDKLTNDLMSGDINDKKFDDAFWDHFDELMDV